jgi:predicted Zn-dependent peptidase
MFFRNACLFLNMTTAMFWRRTILPNGLTVLVYPRQSTNTTQLSIAVEYGSNHEPKEIAGAAHFLEHMLAGGSDKRIQLSRSVENHGGILNFYTDHEHMMSTMDILPEQIGEGSLVISELLFDLDFEEEKFSQERKIILNELAEAADDPTERIEDLLRESLFHEHAVRRPVGGYPKKVKRLTIEQLSKAHRANYVPQNMVLILTGNITEENVEVALKNFQEKTAEAPPPRKTFPAETAKPVPLAVEKKPGIAQAYLCLGARTVTSTHPDAAVLDLTSALLSGGTSSRLFVELREKNALTYDVNSDHNKGVDFGFLSFNCAVKDKNLAKAKSLILKEISRLRTEMVPADELDRNKNLMVADILRGMDTPQDCPDILSYLEMQFKSSQSLVDYIARVKAVSGEAILDAANAYLQEDNISTAIIKPTK